MKLNTYYIKNMINSTYCGNITLQYPLPYLSFEREGKTALSSALSLKYENLKPNLPNLLLSYIFTL